MHNLKDDGESTFDKFRSPQSVEIYPTGGITQHFLETETFNEREEKSLNMAAEWSEEVYERERFNLQNTEGGSTFVAGRKLGRPQAHPTASEVPPTPESPAR